MTVGDLNTVLEKSFGLAKFRKGQQEIIASVLGKTDTLAVMPTGGGKSLCYQLPGQVLKGVVVVISPLISLMDDQTRKLRDLGIPSGAIHSGKSVSEKIATFNLLRTSKQFILYLSPERVQKDGFAEWAKNAPISLFAIDEAHCVSQWGPDFREDYYKLSFLRKLRKDVPILALTASATPDVLRDIVKQLGLKTPDRHIYGFYRPNLYYQVEFCSDDGEKLSYLQSALQQTPKGRILIYCGTRKQTEALASAFHDEFPDFGFYHAGMSAEDRADIQEKYTTGEIRILAATNAFGMGVDHADVRMVVHFQMPANIENYYQEMGRAGRDGLRSTCVLLYSKKDKGLQSYFITQSKADKATISRRWNALNTIVEFAEGAECRHAGILTYFKDTFRLKSCGHCDVCDQASLSRVVISEAAAPTFTPKTVTRKASKKPKAKPKNFEDKTPLTHEEELRYEVVKEWRKSYADENDIPAFLVFSNKTLRDLVRKNPRTLSALEQVYGFGEQKTETLGALVIRELQSCET